MSDDSDVEAMLEAPFMKEESEVRILVTSAMMAIFI